MSFAVEGINNIERASDHTESLNTNHITRVKKQCSLRLNRQISTAFPCPLKFTLDEDEDDVSTDQRSLASVGMWSGNFPSCSASPTWNFTKGFQRSPRLSSRALSVNSSCSHRRGGNESSTNNGLNRQSSLPPPQRLFPETPRPLSKSPVSRNPRLKRQVTIREDSVASANTSMCYDSVVISGYPSASSSVVVFKGSRQGPSSSSQNLSPALITSPKIPLPRQESSFTQEEIYSLQEAFAQLDQDGDGKLSKKEVEAALGKILSEDDLKTLIYDLDTDQNGEVEWQEFLQVMKARMREPENVKMLKEAFRVMASDSDEGFLTTDQIKHSILCAKIKTSDAELEEMLRALDIDNDGKIGIDDFVRLLIHESSDSDNKKSYCHRCVIL